MSDIGDLFKALKNQRIEEGRERRSLNVNDFSNAKELAEKANLKLIQKSDVHYQLKFNDEWIVNIYPGNQRLYSDRNKNKPPYIEIEENWTLTDVVQKFINKMQS